MRASTYVIYNNRIQPVWSILWIRRQVMRVAFYDALTMEGEGADILVGILRTVVD